MVGLKITLTVFLQIISMPIMKCQKKPDMITRVNGEDITGRDMILRALDVLHRLLPHKALENDLYERIIEDKVISHEAIMLAMIKGSVLQVAPFNLL